MCPGDEFRGVATATPAVQNVLRRSRGGCPRLCSLRGPDAVASGHPRSGSHSRHSQLPEPAGAGTTAGTGSARSGRTRTGVRRLPRLRSLSEPQPQGGAPRHLDGTLAPRHLPQDANGAAVTHLHSTLQDWISVPMLSSQPTQNPEAPLLLKSADSGVYNRIPFEKYEVAGTRRALLGFRRSSLFSAYPLRSAFVTHHDTEGGDTILKSRGKTGG